MLYTLTVTVNNTIDTHLSKIFKTEYDAKKYFLKILIDKAVEIGKLPEKNKEIYDTIINDNMLILSQIESNIDAIAQKINAVSIVKGYCIYNDDKNVTIQLSKF